jgi:hypothetical protein
MYIYIDLLRVLDIIPNHLTMSPVSREDGCLSQYALTALCVVSISFHAASYDQAVKVSNFSSKSGLLERQTRHPVFTLRTKFPG